MRTLFAVKYFEKIDMNSTLVERCTFLETIHLRDKSAKILVTVILTSVINTVTAATAIIGNALFLYVFARVSSIRTPSNTLLASLSVTDLLVGLIVQPSSVARRILEFKDIHDCPLRVMFAFFGFLSCGASFLNIGLIALDRCLAICCPFWYEVSVTIRTHGMAICFIWFAWGAFTILPFAGVLSLQVYFIGVFAVLIANTIVFLISYGFISKVIIAKRRNCVSRQVASHANTIYQTNEVIETPEMDRKAEKHLCPESRIDDMQKTWERGGGKRRSYTIAVLVACMLVCYAPQLTVLLMRGTFGDNVNLVFIADAWVDTITFINSSLNPLIYCYRLTDIRVAVSKIFRRATRPANITSSTTRGKGVSRTTVL